MSEFNEWRERAIAKILHGGRKVICPRRMPPVDIHTPPRNAYLPQRVGVYVTDVYAPLAAGPVEAVAYYGIPFGFAELVGKDAEGDGIYQLPPPHMLTDELLMARDVGWDYRRIGESMTLVAIVLTGPS